MFSNVLKHKWHTGFFVVFLVFFISGFYITSFESSAFSSILRIMLVVGLFFLFFIKEQSFSFNKAFLKGLYLSKSRGLYLGLLLFFFYILISTIAFYEWAVLRRLIIVFVFLLMLSFYINLLSFDFKYLIYFLGSLGFLIGVFYLYNYYLINGFSMVKYRQNDLQGTSLEWLASYDNTITAALHISFLCIAAVWGFFNVKSKSASVFYFLAFNLLLLAIVLTFARTAWFAIFSALVVFFFYEFKRNKLKVFILYGILFVAGLFYLNFFYSLDAARGLTLRDKIWIGLLSNMHSVKDWLFGMGPAAVVSFVKVSAKLTPVHAHNIYVETLYRNGIVGLLLFLNLILFSIRNIISASTDKENIFFVAILVGACTAMFFDFSNLIYSPNLLWLWVWFPIAVSLSIRKVA